MSIGLLGNWPPPPPLAWGSQRHFFFAGARVGAAVPLFTPALAHAIWMVLRDAPSGHPFLTRTPESARRQDCKACWR